MDDTKAFEQILNWGWTVAAAIISVLWAILIAMVGILHRQNERRLDNIDENIDCKANKDDLNAMKADLDEVYDRTQKIEISISRMETQLATNSMQLQKIDTLTSKIDSALGMLVDRRIVG